MKQQPQMNDTAQPQNPAEAGLIQKIAAGDQASLTALYSATSRLVFGLLVRILDSRPAAEEVLLDVYTEVWKQAKSYDPARGPWLSWLLSLARVCAFVRLRPERADVGRRELRESAGKPPHAAQGDMTVEMGRQQLARSALNSLTPEQRQIIELAYYGGLSHGEIASKLGQPLASVRTRTLLGMRRFEKQLKAASAEQTNESRQG